MIGPTGVGKTEIARRLAKLVKAPFVKVEASKFTEVGYVGRDVESMIRDLTESAMTMVRTEKVSEVQTKAGHLVEERILDILVPPVKRRKQASVGFSEEEMEEVDENAATREKFREKLKNGELETRTIEIEVTASQIPSGINVVGPISIEDMGVNLQEAFGNLFPKKSKKRKVTIAEARSILTQEEADKLIDKDAAVKEAIERAENSGIVFVDEIDKIASTGGHSAGPDVSREGVQRDLLPVVEGSTVATKYGPVKTDHILFIASGAFHVAKPSDLIPELQGRFPIRVELNSLSEDDFVKILTLPQNALIKQYTALLETEGVKLKFAPEAIRKIAMIAAQVNEQVENIGARRLHTILTTLLEEILFEAPDKYSGETIHVTEEMVEEKLSSIALNRDLSKYIL
jgi:ATP-dependent HslUV protease ATP-binding subunit HslU